MLRSVSNFFAAHAPRSRKGGATGQFARRALRPAGGVGRIGRIRLARRLLRSAGLLGFPRRRQAELLTILRDHRQFLRSLSPYEVEANPPQLRVIVGHAKNPTRFGGQPKDLIDIRFLIGRDILDWQEQIPGANGQSIQQLNQQGTPVTEFL